MWDKIEPTDEWLMAQLPSLLKVGAAALAGSLPCWHCGACPRRSDLGENKKTLTSLF